VVDVVHGSGSRHPLLTGLILDSKNAIQRLLARTRGFVGNVHYRACARGRFLRVCLGKVKSEACPDQLITFTGCRHEALPIKDRDLPSAARNQTASADAAWTGRSQERRPRKPTVSHEAFLSRFRVCRREVETG
jgi:hypothetical protein